MDIYDISLLQDDDEASALMREELAITLLTRLVPATSAFASHADGNVRGLVASALRRLVPPLVSFTVATTSSGKEVSAADMTDGDSDSVGAQRKLAARNVCMKSLMTQVPRLLGDQAPIPQYVIRLLADVCMSSETLAATVCSQLAQGQGLAQLIMLLKEALSDDRYNSGAASATIMSSQDNPKTASHDVDRDVDLDLDPQLAVILRVVLEKPDCQVAVLEAGLSTALVTAMTAAVNKNSSGLIVGLLDLLHVTLHHSSRTLNNAMTGTVGGKDRGDAAGGPRSRYAQRMLSDVPAATLKDWIQPLAQLSIPLLLVMSDAAKAERDREKEGPAMIGGGSGPAAWAPSVSAATLDSASMCGSILFELFPDTVASILLVKDLSGTLNYNERGAGNSNTVIHIANIISNLLISSNVRDC